MQPHSPCENGDKKFSAPDIDFFTEMYLYTPSTMSSVWQKANF